MSLVLIVARADNGVIGKDNRLPWHLPADLKRFKRLTMGHPMIMGRRTFDSLPGVLPGRRHLVLTRDSTWSAPGAERVGSVDEALAAAGEDEVYVIGGAEIFALFEPLADAVELTEVHGPVEGDVRMAPFDEASWAETMREDHPAEEGRPAFSFVRLERR